ncbi:MAG: hypothetical protein R3A10_06300 [Caldilineaceae bacterium]
MVVLLLLEAPIAGVLRTGRRLETRVRIAFLEKLPRLGDRYFHSRLISDMAQRAYGLHQLHTLPDLALRFLRLCCQLALTTAGIIWIYPDSALLAVAALASAIGGTLLLQPLQTERDMRAYLRQRVEPLLSGCAHGADALAAPTAPNGPCVANMKCWWSLGRENLALARVQVLAQSLTSLLGIGFAVWIVFSYISARGPAPLLLLLYWTLNLPVLGQALAASAHQYPAVRNSMSRILEPLGAPKKRARPMPHGHKR